MKFEDYILTDEGKDMIKKLKTKLSARDFDVPEGETVDAVLLEELESAIEAVNERRHFISTPEMLFEPKYNSIVRRLVITSISKYGAEGQTSHNENGIARSYEKGSEYPESIMNSIVPLARVSSL